MEVNLQRFLQRSLYLKITILSWYFGSVTREIESPISYKYYNKRDSVRLSSNRQINKKNQFIYCVIYFSKQKEGNSSVLIIRSSASTFLRPDPEKSRKIKISYSVKGCGCWVEAELAVHTIYLYSIKWEKTWLSD